MAESAIASRGLLGMEAPAVTVETHIAGGLPGFTMVGLPETAVREARDRVKSALQNCGFKYPDGRVVVNLAPADLVKEGARYDLAIAVSILCATKQLAWAKAKHYEYLGELSLYGDIRRVRGVLGALHALAQTKAKRHLVVPTDNAAEAQLRQDQPVLALSHLARIAELVAEPAPFFVEPDTPAKLQPEVAKVANSQEEDDSDQGTLNANQQSGAGSGYTMDQVIGQSAAKRALVVAAAGGHHLLMVGPPGSGKTLLARCLPGLLPPLAGERAMEVGAIYSAAGLPVGHRQPPFREPHHSASAVALAGGGSKGHIQPGEISLAHHGVLFLDEMPHFKPTALDLLREPMSNGYITIARARGQTRFPARFQLLAAMNPCPAGLACHPQSCRCTLTKVRQYQNRISGPLLDRIDLQTQVPAVPVSQLINPSHSQSDLSAHQARTLVHTAQTIQLERQGCLNAEIQGNAQPAQFGLTNAAQVLLQRSVERLALSARGYHRILKVAQTIADLSGSADIGDEALGEALAYRGLDWGNQLGLGGI